MGGEPTFVSVDDRDGAEWNTAALGPTKRASRDDLLQRLRAALRRGRLPALRPGQVVSRRAAAALGAGCYWRKDGEPCWTRPERCSPTSSDRHRDTSARRRALPRRARRAASASTGDHVQPATRTSGTTCGASASCRSTSIRSTRGSTTSSSATACAACSSRASTRRRRLRAAARARRGRRPRSAGSPARGSCATSACYLMPGDSPMGYRLPLDSLPWVDRRPTTRTSRARSVRAAQRLAAGGAAA